MVRFYFDFVSPYAYIAWTQIHRVVEGRGGTVEPVPVLFAGLLNAHGQKGPASTRRGIETGPRPPGAKAA